MYRKFVRKWLLLKRNWPILLRVYGTRPDANRNYTDLAIDMQISLLLSHSQGGQLYRSYLANAVIRIYVYIHTDLLITAVIEIPLARTCGCLSLCVCVCVCICVHNLTSASGDLIPGQFSAGCIRRPGR